MPLPPPREVHIWHTSLDAPEPERLRYFALLSAEERARVARFRFDEHRTSAIVCRGWLRTVLARYTGTDPSSLLFRLGTNGKPELPACAVRFNVSHSGRRAVCAVVSDVEVGIDIEVIRPLSDLEAMATQYFAPGEARKILALTPAARVAAFYRCWSRKEAYIKATGEGLSAALDTFEVSVLADEPVAFLRLPEAAGSAQAWSLFEISVPGGAHAGALAIPHKDWQIRPMRF